MIFQAPGGSPGYNQFETLDAAVAFVEQLRNERDVSNARIFALEEVKFELKPYFKVELQALTRSTGQGSVAGTSEAPSPESPRSTVGQPSPVAPAGPAPSQPEPAPPAPAAPECPACTVVGAPQAPRRGSSGSGGGPQDTCSVGSDPGSDT
ncbi:MAG: hypothetical protein M5U19_08430 [Microthrixaceae bacterium]|nr:hypothetical protein [Microthrixaceae bacterium]